MGTEFEFDWLCYLKIGDAVYKYDNRFHPNGTRYGLKKGIIVAQEGNKTTINWVEGSTEEIVSNNDVRMLVKIRDV